MKLVAVEYVLFTLGALATLWLVKILFSTLTSMPNRESLPENIPYKSDVDKVEDFPLEIGKVKEIHHFEEIEDSPENNNTIHEYPFSEEEFANYTKQDFKNRLSGGF